MGVLCMVMLSAVTSVNSEPPDTMFVSKKDDTISGWVFFWCCSEEKQTLLYKFPLH